MTSAIFSLLPVRETSTIASVRIGRWLSIILGLPLHDSAQIAELGQLDVLFIINGSTLYCKCLEQLAEAVRGAKQVVWVQNDYTLPPPKSESDAQSPFRRAFADRKLVPHYWSTCEENAEKTPCSAWVNWNVLGYREGVAHAKLDRPNVLYYGAHRENRAKRFHEIISAFEGLDLEISSTSAKFPDHLRVDPIRSMFYEHLALYSLGIYIQDEKSSKMRHSPATRFYEMLSVGLPMVFTKDCEQTLSHYGYDVRPYVVCGKPSAAQMLDLRIGIAGNQQLWVQDFASALTRQVKELYGRLG